MIILGINAYHANAAAAIVVDGRLVAAVEEERLNRVKYAAGLPARAIQFCLDRAGVKLTEVDHIAVPRDPWARLGTKLRFAMRMPRFALDRVRVMRRFAGIREDLASAFQVAPDAIRGQFHRIEHHTAHLASAFFVSPFDRAAVLSADGLGDFASSMCAVGEGPKMRVLGEVAFPHSLGMYYTALTQYLGFWKFGDEYKVMGLAAYGQPEFLEEFRRIVWSDGPLSFRLGLEYFTHQKPGRGNDVARCDRARRCSAASFRHILKSASAPRARRTSLSRSATTISPPACRRRSRKCSSPTGMASRRQAGRRRCVLRAAWLSIAWPTAESSIRLLSSGCTCSRRRATRGFRSALRFAVDHQILGRPREFVMEHAYWGPQFSPAEIRAVVDRVGSADEVEIAQLDEDGARARDRATYRRRQNRRLVSGSAPNGGRARWAIAAFWPTRGAPR